MQMKIILAHTCEEVWLPRRTGGQNFAHAGTKESDVAYSWVVKEIYVEKVRVGG